MYTLQVSNCAHRTIAIRFGVVMCVSTQLGGSGAMLLPETILGQCDASQMPDDRVSHAWISIISAHCVKHAWISMISAHCVKQYWLVSPFRLFANLHWHSCVSAGKREGKCDWHINQVNISHIDVISCILFGAGEETSAVLLCPLTEESERCWRDKETHQCCAHPVQ